MKELNLLVWLTQLGISVAGPLAGFILLAVWLRQRFDLASCGHRAGNFRRHRRFPCFHEGYGTNDKEQAQPKRSAPRFFQRSRLTWEVSMDNRKYVISQTLTVLVGELVLSALMVGVFALLGYFDKSVLFGAAASSVIATINHLVLVLGVLGRYVL